MSSEAGTNMVKNNKNKGENLFGAVLMVHLILFLHLLIIAGIVLMVIFFRGITQYTLWIFLGATVLFLLSVFIVIRRIRSRGKKVFRDIEDSSLYQGRDFEVSFLSGLVSLKFGRPDGLKAIENKSPGVNLQLEDPETVRIRDLAELARMYEKNLITLEEYNETKNQILKSL
jgi:hypothetical protein